jgi:hypothetical protein
VETPKAEEAAPAEEKIVFEQIEVAGEKEKKEKKEEEKEEEKKEEASKE